MTCVHPLWWLPWVAQGCASRAADGFPAPPTEPFELTIHLPPDPPPSTGRRVMGVAGDVPGRMFSHRGPVQSDHVAVVPGVELWCEVREAVGGGRYADVSALVVSLPAPSGPSSTLVSCQLGAVTYRAVVRIDTGPLPEPTILGEVRLDLTAANAPVGSECKEVAYTLPNPTGRAIYSVWHDDTSAIRLRCALPIGDPDMELRVMLCPGAIELLPQTGLCPMGDAALAVTLAPAP